MQIYLSNFFGSGDPCRGAEPWRCIEVVLTVAIPQVLERRRLEDTHRRKWALRCIDED